MLIFKMSMVNLLCLILVQPFSNKTLDTVKRRNNFYTFKHNLKNYFLKELRSSKNTF